MNDWNSNLDICFKINRSSLHNKTTKSDQIKSNHTLQGFDQMCWYRHQFLDEHKIVRSRFDNPKTRKCHVENSRDLTHTFLERTFTIILRFLKLNQIKSSQIEWNQVKSSQIRSNQIKSDQIRSVSENENVQLCLLCS